MGRSRSKSNPARRRVAGRVQEESSISSSPAVSRSSVKETVGGLASAAQKRAEKLRSKLVTSEMNPILDFILTIVIMCLSPFMIFWVRAPPCLFPCPYHNSIPLAPAPPHEHTRHVCLACAKSVHVPCCSYTAKI